MNTLIVGANSFLGQVLVTEIKKNSENNLVCVRRCRSADEICFHTDESWFCVDEGGHPLSQTVFKFNKIYLLSTIYSKKIEDAQSIIRCNLEYLTTILISQINSELKHVVYSNSYMALPQILNPLSSPYAKSKDLFSHIAKDLATKHNFNFDNVYLFDILGPEDNRRKLLQLIAESYHKKTPLDMSEGHQLIAPLSVFDAARILSALQIRVGSPNIRDYLLHGNEIFTVRKFIELIESLYQLQFEISWGALTPGSDQIYQIPQQIQNLAKDNQQDTIVKTVSYVLDPLLL